MSECDRTYKSKLREEHALEIVNQNEMNSEPYGDIVDFAFSSYRIDLSHNMDSFAQKENKKTNEVLEEKNI